MADPWAIDVYSAAGTLRRTLTPADPVADFTWSVRGDGDCLEAEIRGVDLGIRARDIVIIRTIGDGDSTPKPRYVGWAVETPGRQPDIATTRLVGGSKRLREILVHQFRLAGGDVTFVARLAANDITAAAPPLMSVSTIGSADFPYAGFEIGVRYPGLEPISDTFDALAATAPGFTVAAGTTYSYAGRTYVAGEEVPPMAWGVRVAASGAPRGSVFFARPNPTARTLTELADALIIDWPALSSERVVDDVTVVVIEQHTERVREGFHELERVDTDYLVEPVVRRFQRPGSPYGAQLRVGAEGQGLKAGTWAGPATRTGYTNSNNAWDANLSSYASNPASWPVGIARPASPSTVALRIRYSSVIPVSVRASRVGTGFGYTWQLPSTSGNQNDVHVITPLPDSAANVHVDIETPYENATAAADSIRIYDVTPLQVDEAVLARIAEANFTPPPNTAAVVTVPNRIVPYAWRWSLTLADGSTLAAKAERIEYRVAADAGITTTVYLGQALSAEESSARALMDSNVARVVRAGRRGAL